MIKRFFLLALTFLAQYAIYPAGTPAYEYTVHKEVLKNGLTVLVRKTTHIPRVAVQLWYHVGSKDEETHEKGLAHLLEHMCFKGTAGKKSLNLSETDIPALTHQLSGSCNATTGYDTTNYIFEFPSQYWHHALPVLADLMRNCSFKTDLLNSEFKAVLQELKMNRDKYSRSLFQELLGTIFADHPYHYPVIGFKHDIWNVTSADLQRFYRKHYVPNNATLVIVGDVDPQQAFAQARTAFGKIPADTNYVKKQFHSSREIAAKSVTLYRDIHQPEVLLTFVTPGMRENCECALDALAHIIGGDGSSRLYQRLYEEEQLVHSISAWSMLFFDHGILGIDFEPHSTDDIATIKEIILEELEALKKDGPTPQDLTRVLRSMQCQFYNLIENNSTQARVIGERFVATGNEQYLKDYFNRSPEALKEQMLSLAHRFVRPCVMHTAQLLPMPSSEKEHWQSLVRESDEQDSTIIAQRPRSSAVEPVNYAKTIKPAKPSSRTEKKTPEVLTLANGLRVLLYHNPNVPTISVSIRLAARPDHDSITHPGLYGFTVAVMGRGTQKRSFKELTDTLSLLGAGISMSPGTISMSTLRETCAQSFALLEEYLTKPVCNPEEIEKIRATRLMEIESAQDSPGFIAQRLVYETLYAGHPWSKNTLGTTESIKAITQEQIEAWYARCVTPDKATVAVAGDFTGIDIKQLITQHLGSWTGEKAPMLEYPELTPVKAQELKKPMLRDQVYLTWSGLSVARTDKRHLPLCIFSRILSGSMHSKLFQLREQTGLFYTAYGSLVESAGKQPGLATMSTIVSPDQCAVAKELFERIIDTVIDTITAEEVADAKRAMINDLVGLYATNGAIADTLLFLQEYELPCDYFDQRVHEIEAMTLEEIKIAARSVLKRDQMICVAVGRV